jgi:DNA mismatch endonuclease (patch repair protein)
MAAVRGKDTKPEMLVRRGLHARGFRYRLGGAGLPGRPDLVFPRYRAVIFVNGCFWHGHGCHLFRSPGTRREFWEAKITQNVERDSRNLKALYDLGWRTAVVWECALRGKQRIALPKLLEALATWLASDCHNLSLEGRPILPA